MECRYKYAHINIRYTLIFYFPKIFCPDFSVKIFIHKSNVLSDLYRTLIISIRLSFYVKIKGMHFGSQNCINFGSQILIFNSGRLQISRHISLVANNFLSTRQKFCFFPQSKCSLVACNIRLCCLESAKQMFCRICYPAT